MAKTLLAACAALLLVALAFLLPPYLFALSDKARLETPVWEAYTALSVNQAPLTAAQKLAVLAEGTPQVLLLKDDTTPPAAIQEALEKLLALLELPVNLSADPFYTGEIYLYTDGDRSVRLQSCTAGYGNIKFDFLYDPQDEKIYQVTLYLLDETFEEFDAMLQETHILEAFAEYLGVSYTESEAYPGYYPLDGDQSGTGFYVLPNPAFFIRDTLSIVPRSEKSLLEEKAKSSTLVSGESSLSMYEKSNTIG